MAELLVLNFDTSNRDATRDVFAYKAGHVISIQPDGHEWGKEECLPKFQIIKLPDVKVDEVQKYMQAKMSTLGDATEAIAIRDYKIDLSSMDTAAKDDSVKAVVTEKEGITQIASLKDFEAYAKK